MKLTSFYLNFSQADAAWALSQWEMLYQMRCVGQVDPLEQLIIAQARSLFPTLSIVPTKAASLTRLLSILVKNIHWCFGGWWMVDGG